MIKYNNNSFLLLLATVILSILCCDTSCKKSANNSSEETTTDVYENTNSNNDYIGLQSLSHSSNGWDLYIYGNFNSDGSPNRAKRAVFQKTGSDTLMNFFFDDNLNLQYAYMSHP